VDFPDHRRHTLLTHPTNGTAAVRFAHRRPPLRHDPIGIALDNENLIDEYEPEGVPSCHDCEAANLPTPRSASSMRVCSVVRRRGRWPLRMGSAIAMTDCELMRIDKTAMMLALHRENKLSDMFTAYLLGRNIRYEADLVDQLFSSSEKSKRPVVTVSTSS